jgi:hypothetical protein
VESYNIEMWAAYKSVGWGAIWSETLGWLGEIGMTAGEAAPCRGAIVWRSRRQVEELLQVAVQLCAPYLLKGTDVDYV